MLRWAGLLALMLVALCAGTAHAAQVVDDPDDGVAEAWFGDKQLDVRRVAIDQAAGQTTVAVSIEPPYDHDTAENDHVMLFIDSNGDALSEFGVAFSGFARTPYHWALVSTPASQLRCQRFAGGAPVVEGDTEVPAAQDGLVTLTATFPTASIGGAESFRWAVYAMNDSLVRATYDYVPDASNPRTPSSGTATQNVDGCDNNGDGTYGGSGDETTFGDFSFPVDLAQGTEYTASVFETVDVSERPKMPNVKGKGLGDAVDLIQKAGINAIIEKRPVTKRIKGKTPGTVLSQSPARGRRIPTGTQPFKKIRLKYYLGPIAGAGKDGCRAKALTAALRGEDPATTQAYLDSVCDEVGVRYRFSGKVDEATLTTVANDTTADLRILCRGWEVDGQDVELCDVVRVPADTEKNYFEVPCEVNEKKVELVCKVVKKKRDKPKDQNDVIGEVVVPKKANDLILALSDAEEFTKDNPFRIGFTSDWRFLTTNQHQLRHTCVRVQVLTAGGELVENAKVALAIPVGMSPDKVVEEESIGTRGVAFCVRFFKPGDVWFVATAAGRNGGVIHGVKKVEVEELVQERVLLDERRIRPQGSHNGTALFEVVDQQQLAHEAQLATGGGKLTTNPGIASTVPQTVTVANANNTVTVHQNVPVVPSAQLQLGVQGTAGDGGVNIPGIGTYDSLLDADRSSILDADLSAGIISDNGASMVVGAPGSGLIGQAGGNIISDNGASLIGQAGGN
jgi:hypothetical protein